MLSWILLLIVLAALVVVGTWFWGTLFGRGEVLPPMEDGPSVIETNRTRIGAGEIDNVRFDLVTRGYRPEQVDDAISHLQWQLQQARRQLAEYEEPAAGTQ